MRLRSIRHRQSDPYPPPPRSVEHRGIHQKWPVRQFNHNSGGVVLKDLKIMVHWKICSLLFIGYLLKGLVVASQASNLGDLAKILAQLAGGENCAFRCPKGKRVLGCSKI